MNEGRRRSMWQQKQALIHKKQQDKQTHTYIIRSVIQSTLNKANNSQQKPAQK